MRLYVYALLLGFFVITACANDGAERSTNNTASKAKSHQTDVSELEKRKKNLREKAKEARNIRPSEVMKQRGLKLAEQYCNCLKIKDKAGTRSCKSRVDKTYFKMQERLPEDTKESFKEAYESRTKTCKNS